LAAAAPERKLVEIATLAARDPDPEIRRALAAGLARNSAPGVGDFTLLNGLNLEEGASLADGNIRDRGNSEED
jgi:hypothetical protein